MDNRALMEEALTRTVDSMGGQTEQMSIRMGELESAVHVERESLREEVNRNRQEVSRSENRMKERTDEYLAKNLSRMTSEAEQRERRLRNKSASWNRGANSGERNREPRVNFNDYLNRGRTYGSTRGRDNSSSYATGNNMPRDQRKSEEILLATDRPQLNDRCETQMRLEEVISQAGVTRIKEDVNPATLTGGKIRSLNQRATTIKRGIHVMQRQWLQN